MADSGQSPSDRGIEMPAIRSAFAGTTVTAIDREPFRPDAEPLLRSLEHPARAAGHSSCIVANERQGTGFATDEWLAAILKSRRNQWFSTDSTLE